MARGTGTNRAMSEQDIAKLIRGDKDALAKQAATGGNTKPATAPGTTPTPAAATPNPANPANPTQPPTGMPPVATPAQAAANAAASAAGVTAPNNPNAPTSPATPPEKDKEKKEEEKKTIQYADKGGSGPQFLFGMAGKGDINEGADAGAAMGAQQELLKKLVKKIQAKSGGAPTPPPPSK